ncbi:MAG: hypothetical protein ACR2FL_00810 [Nocardioidaceae bacterium]
MDPYGLLAMVLWATTAATPASDDPSQRLVSVLERLDQRRRAAFRRADPAMLDRVYAHSSTLLGRDAATVRAYARRVLQVRDVDRTLLSLDVERYDPRTARVRVVDRLGPVHVRRPGERWTALPVDLPTERVIVLRHTFDGWRIVAAHRVAG